MPVIALLTDFGLRDTYVGVMKGVMLKIAPAAQLVDLSHHIPPQDVRGGALALLNAYGYFPPATVFLVVVDPGVGTTRRPLAVQAGDYTFVAPDNGVLTYALSELGDVTAVELASLAHRLARTSATFHGRDIFAPAAAHLAMGVMLPELGPPAAELVRLPLPVLQVERSRISGEVTRVDHFGNIVTSIARLHWSDAAALHLAPRFDVAEPCAFTAANAVIRFGEHSLAGVSPTYGGVEQGRPLALVGSSGELEIAVNGGSAAELFGLTVGAPVLLELDPAAARK